MRIQRKRALVLTMSLGSIAAWLVVACVGDEPIGTITFPDAAADAIADAQNDSGPEMSTAACKPDEPFVQVIPLMGFPDAGGASPTFTPDELTVYFASGDELYTASRDSPTSPLKHVQPLLTVNGATTKEADPSLSGGFLYFTSDSIDGDAVKTTHDLDIFRVPIAALATARQRIGDIDQDTSDDYAPVLDQAGTIYFTSNRSTHSRILAATAIGAGFNNVGEVDGINSTLGDDSYPVVSADGLVMYWSSTRPDPGAQGAGDIFMATRTDPGSKFDHVKHLDSTQFAFEKLGDDRPSWISPDGCRLYIWHVTAPLTVDILSRR